MIDVKKEIQHLKDLENEYRKCCQVAKVGEKTKNAFLEWYNAVVAILGEFYPADNSDFIGIQNQDVTGGGYNIYRVYQAISSKCHFMLGEIESGKTSIRPTAVVELKEKKDTPDEAKQPLIFISHASADGKIIREFIDNILISGLGLVDENIICTSFSWTTVKPGSSIPDYIKDNIAKASVVLSMVSKAYKRSEVCQNEVGAAWALNNEPISVVLPDSDYKEIGWLFNLEKAIKIDDQDSLNLLQETLCNRLGLTLKSSLHWSPYVKKFLNSIKNVSGGDDSMEKEAEEDNSSKLPQEAIEHDRTCFKLFDSEFGEERIEYSLYGLQTTTHFSDYDLSIWLNIIQWLKKTSNGFINSQVQSDAEELLKALKDLEGFTCQYYSPDRISWNTENDRNVSPEKWREIHEAKIYSWELDTFDENQRKREEIVINGITELIPKVEEAYKAFRLSVKNNLFV